MSKDNGGPAFGELQQVGDVTMRDGGLSIRDYFAAKADISHEIEDDGCIGQRLAIALMDGAMPPSWDNDYLEARIWWARAESRLRYMKADAMLLERAK